MFLRFSTAHRKETLEKNKRKKWLLKKVSLFALIKKYSAIIFILKILKYVNFKIFKYHQFDSRLSVKVDKLRLFSLFSIFQKENSNFITDFIFK